MLGQIDGPADGEKHFGESRFEMQKVSYFTYTPITIKGVKMSPVKETKIDRSEAVNREEAAAILKCEPKSIGHFESPDDPNVSKSLGVVDNERVWSKASMVRYAAERQAKAAAKKAESKKTESKPEAKKSTTIPRHEPTGRAAIPRTTRTPKVVA
jgi:hypothetical protein